MFIKNIYDTQFDPLLSSRETFIKKWGSAICVISGLTACVVGFLVSINIGGGGTLIAAAFTGIISAFFFISAIEISQKQERKYFERRQIKYLEYLQTIDKDILMHNVYSPEHNNETKHLIQHQLNTHHKGWSVPEHVFVDHENEICASRQHTSRFSA